MIKLKITLIPTWCIGLTWLPGEDQGQCRSTITSSYYYNIMGRVTEQIILVIQNLEAGASNDLQQVTNIAH
jgi:ATP-dependent Zn protease